MQFLNATESIIQQYCKREIECLNAALQLQNKIKHKLIDFVHIDNGGKSGIQHKIKKKKEGTREGFPDVMIICSNLNKNACKVLYIEFKRIGTPSQIQIKPNQIEYNNWLNDIGFDAYIINNPLFFKNKIIKDIQDFINK